jgi:hypothetical protein
VWIAGSGVNLGKGKDGIFFCVADLMMMRREERRENESDETFEISLLFLFLLDDRMSECGVKAER